MEQIRHIEITVILETNKRKQTEHREFDNLDDFLEYLKAGSQVYAESIPDLVDMIKSKAKSLSDLDSSDN